MKLLTIREVARILSLSERTLYQWSWLKKNLPFIRVGRSLRVSEEDLLLLIRKNKREIKDSLAPEEKG